MKIMEMHSAGIEPATINLEGCCSKSTELRMHFLVTFSSVQKIYIF